MGVFDEFAKQFGDNSEPEEEPADVVEQVVQELNDEDIDDEMRDAQKRLSKAAYYKEIVRSGVIEENGSAEATEINAEARLWARQRMVCLLKGEAPAPAVAQTQPLPFSEKEILALKAVAGKVLVAQGESPAEPVAKKIQTSPAPAVRQIQTKPIATPVVKKQGIATKRPSVSPSKTEVKKNPKSFLKPKRDSEGKIDYDAIPTDVVFVDIDGSAYKMVPHPDEDNRRVKRKITGQVKNVGGIPMPTSRQQIEAISQQQSMATIDAGASASASSPFGSDSHVTPAHFVAAAALSQRKE